MTDQMPWDDFLRRAVFSDELGGDPFDVGDDAEYVVNRHGEVRVIFDTGPSSDQFGGMDRTRTQYYWLDPLTGKRYRSTQEQWAQWAGYQVWFLEHDGTDWTFRSAFANDIESDPAE